MFYDTSPRLVLTMFKVGDLVRCVNPGVTGNLLEKGKIYTILECCDFYDSIMIRVNQENPVHFVFMSRFELLEIPMKKSHLPDWM